MKVGIISVFTDYQRRGRHHRGALQPQIGPLIAALLPSGVQVHIVNDTWEDPDWRRDYDLLFLSCLHSDFDRARQISHYWRRRGASTVLGGNFATTYPVLCQPYFDAIACGDPESTVPQIVRDFSRRELKPVYLGSRLDAACIPQPRIGLVARKQVLPLAVEATRGCPFACDFCALTALGTRHHTRPVSSVLREIVEGQRLLRDLVSWPRRRIVIFYDNNLGGNPAYLRQLCEAFRPLGIRWGACVTFNIICQDDLIDHLYRGGCRCVFVGLESFNPAAIEGMNKRQNVIGKMRAAIDRCREKGILVMAGLMLSPINDSLAYIGDLPRALRESGLHVPTYISFETPFPGTPHFRSLAEAAEPAFLPHALLRDFTGYTLVTRPRHATAEAFVAAFRQAYKRIYSPISRLRKLADDVPRFARGGHVVSMLFDLYELASETAHLDADRTFIAGTDRAPPEAEAVPFDPGDFRSEEQRADIVDPWPVADGEGRVLPMWLTGRPFYSAKGRVRHGLAYFARRPMALQASCNG